MRCVNLNAREATVRQCASTIYKLGDNMIYISTGHGFWHPKSEIPDDGCSQPITNMKRNLTRRNRFPKYASFTCSSRGLAAGVAYLSDRGRTVLLASICILLPRLKWLIILF